MPFHFLDPGLLIDGELRLVEPRQQWIDDVLVACRHPETRRLDSSSTKITRQRLQGFLDANPHGHQPPDDLRGWAPAYHFWMLVDNDDVPVRIAGGLNLRIGHSENLEKYAGHIGYHVYPPARGRHYAERACRLLFPLAKAHGLSTLWITCNPDNIPSRRTCERLGAELVEIVPVPKDHELYARGDREKCRYRVKLVG